MARRVDWLEAPRWWRRYKPLRWLLAIVILAWIYTQAMRMERGPMMSERASPASSATSSSAPSAKPSDAEKAPPAKAAPERAAPAPAKPPPKKKAPPEKRKEEIRSLRPV
jgi:hypothetical protein